MSTTNNKRTEISSLGEFGLIDRIKQQSSPIKQPTTLKGIGDDAAVIDKGKESMVISTDMLVEDIHFDLSYTSLPHLGYKAVVVNLSDIYAMNATPRQVLVSISLSNRFSVEAIDALYDGIRKACDLYQVDLVGGDTCSSQERLTISVTAIGSADQQKITYRNGAKPGDLVCVSGKLGAAYVGLLVLNREKEVFLANPKMQPKLTEHLYEVSRQLKPEARKDIVEYLGEQGIKPTSMIDISDGLSSELIHLAKQSNVGCHIYEANIPIENSTYNQALEFQIDPTTCMLNGGEDYELLFTIDPKDESKINTDAVDLSFIGKITDKKEQYLIQTRANNIHQMTAQGWNALKK